MARKKPLTNRHIGKAEELVKRFGNLPLPNMNYETLTKLVEVFYSKIREIPIRELDGDQLYRIAERLYNESHKIIAEQDRLQRSILEKIRELEGTIDHNKRELIEHQICIQLEGNNLPEDAYLSKRYMQSKQERVPF